MNRSLPLLLVCAVLGACGERDPVDSEANAAGLPAINEPAPNPTGGPPRNSASSEAPRSSLIPAALHGRWGLTPMDCTSTRGDAKDLLIVGPVELRFYESRAVPGPDTQAGEDSIAGDFTFTGEGQMWTRFEALELKGQELVRTESNPVASFTYARCK